MTYQKRLPQLNWLRAFEASARYLSFTLAANELCMTQSAVSQQIRLLENYLGKPLFYRRTRALELTEVGLSYLPTVQEAFATLSAGTRILMNDRSEQSLEVQVSLGFAMYWLRPRLSSLYKQYPWINLNINTAIWAPENTAASAHVEIRFGKGNWSGVESQKLRDESIFPVCSAEFGQRMQVPSDALSERLYDSFGVSETWHSWFRAQELELLDDNPVNYASVYAMTVGATQYTDCLAMGHGTIAQQWLDEGRLVRPFKFSLPIEEAYYLILPSRGESNHAVEVFVDWLLQECNAP